jgi:hypothetical protein
MDLIWAKREAKYFFERDWTGSISLIGFDKSAVWRNSNCHFRGERSGPSAGARKPSLLAAWLCGG